MQENHIIIRIIGSSRKILMAFLIKGPAIKHQHPTTPRINQFFRLHTDEQKWRYETFILRVIKCASDRLAHYRYNCRENIYIKTHRFVDILFQLSD